MTDHGGAGQETYGSRGTPHEIVNPSSMAAPAGFSHAVVTTPGRTIYLGGQTAQRGDGSIVGETLVEQFEHAAGNLAAVLDACGARPHHLAALTVYTTRVGEYRESLSGIGKAYRRRLGRHYPAMALFGVTELFDPAFLIELVGVAVVPE